MNNFNLDTEKKVSLETSRSTFKSSIEAFVQDNELRTKLSQANLLLIPQKGLLDDPDLIFFPSGTEELLQFLEKYQRDGVVTDICVEEKDYKELTRNADLVFLATTVVSTACISIAADLVVEYLLRKLGSKRSEAMVHWEVIIQHENTDVSTKISYYGPATEVKETILTLANQIDSQQLASKCLIKGNSGLQRRKRNTKKRKKG